MTIDHAASCPNHGASPSGPSLLNTLVGFVGADRSVVYGLARHLWGLLAAPVTIVLMTRFFTPEIQGYYYTFSHLMLVQVLVELGLGQVIQTLASHEWFKLRIDGSGVIVGDERARARLGSLGRLAIRMYVAVGVGVAAGLAAVGIVFFSSSTESDVAWRGPWLLLCLTTGMSLSLTPLWSLLEGCNQIRAVYGFRLLQALVNRVVIWLAIALGVGLWTGPLASVADLLAAVAFLVACRQFFVGVLSRASGHVVAWRTEVWPLQWQTALSWLSSFVYGVFTPVLFAFHGAVLAGQMGMTWVLVSALSQISTTWLMTKAPQFAMLAAAKDHAGLDRIFMRSALVSLIVAALGSLAVEGGLLLLQAWEHPIAGRLLPPLPTALFLLGAVLAQVYGAEVMYLRAHKREPLMAVSVTTGIGIVVLAYVLGRDYGATGIGAAYCAVVALAMVPAGTFITLRCRQAWHGFAPGVSRSV